LPVIKRRNGQPIVIGKKLGISVLPFDKGETEGIFNEIHRFSTLPYQPLTPQDKEYVWIGHSTWGRRDVLRVVVPRLRFSCRSLWQ
jgi:hypothetical protein